MDIIFETDDLEEALLIFNSKEQYNNLIKEMEEEAMKVLFTQGVVILKETYIVSQEFTTTFHSDDGAVSDVDLLVELTIDTKGIFPKTHFNKLSVMKYSFLQRELMRKAETVITIY